MGLLGRLAVAVLGLAMVLTVAGASGAFAINQTVLDGEQLNQTLDEEGVYASIATEGQTELRDRIDELLDDTGAIPSGVGLDVDSRAMAEAALTESYVATEASANIDRGLTFLRGNASTLSLGIDLEPVKESIGTAVADEVTVDTVALAREIDFESATDDIVVTEGMIERLNDDAAGYTAVRANVRSQIEQALPSGASDAQIDAALEETNTELKEAISDQTRSEYGDRVSAETLESVIALQATVVDGLTDPDLTAETYTTRRDDTEAALADAIGAELRDRVDQQVDDRIEFGDVTAESNDGVSMARTGMKILETLTIALPAAFVALAGLIFVVTRSLLRTASAAGRSLLLVGVVGLAGGILGREPALNALDTAIGPTSGEPVNAIIGDAIGAILDSLLVTIASQSQALTAAGLILVVAATLGKRGYLDRS